MTTCPNCGDDGTSRYCSACGQRQGDLRPTVHDWLRETLAELFFVESRVPKTLAALARPGRLTSAWVQGRRASYISPLRLYMLTATLFFLFSPPAQSERILSAIGDTMSGFVAGMEDGSEGAAAMPWAQDLGVDAERIAGMLPRTTLVLFVPLFAVVLHVLPLRTPRRYAEVLVLAFHFWAFAFIVSLCIAILRRAIGVDAEWINDVAILGVFVYLFMALRNVYDRGWIRTGLFTVFVAVSSVVLFACCVLLLWSLMIATSSP